MAKYRITEKSFIDSSLYGPGEVAGDIVEVGEDVVPGKAWVRIDEDDDKPARKPRRGKKVEEQEADEAEESSEEQEADELA